MQGKVNQMSIKTYSELITLPTYEERFNYLFTTGIKEYMDMYSPRVTESYESELETVSDWTR